MADNDTDTPTRLYKDQQDVLHAAACARDEALAWVADLIHQRESKGVGAALTAFDRMQERVERMQDRLAGSDADTGGTADHTYIIEYTTPPEPECPPPSS